MNSCEQGLVGFAAYSVIITICSIVAINRMRYKLRREKPNQVSKGQGKSTQKK